jgi:hypothetical protein
MREKDYKGGSFPLWIRMVERMRNPMGSFQKQRGKYPHPHPPKLMWRGSPTKKPFSICQLPLTLVDGIGIVVHYIIFLFH